VINQRIFEDDKAQQTNKLIIISYLFYSFLKYFLSVLGLEISTVAAVEISDRKDLNTLYKFRNLISVNRIFIKEYKVSVSI
jgi:hypothetical protein